MTENDIRTKVVNTAIRHLGCEEGSKEHKQIIDLFNTVKPDGWKMTYTAAWCAAFATEVLIEALGASDAKKVAPMSANCDNMIKRAKEMGCWIENDAYIPKKGDMVLYDWQDTGKGDNKGGSDHVGIVEKAGQKTITVIEGNYSDMVKRRTIQVNSRYIRGFATPLYSKIATKETTPKKTEQKKTEPKKAITVIAKEVIAGKWGNGEDRRKKLKAAGYNPDTVQKKVNELLAQMLTTKTSCNMRVGAGMRYKKIEHLNKGVRVTRIGQAGNWIKVNHNGKVGYI